MASDWVYREIKQLVVAAVSGATVVDFDEVDDALLQRDEPFFALRELSGDERMQSLGAPSSARQEEIGSVGVIAFVRSTLGQALAREVVTALRNALRHRQINATEGHLRTGPAHPGLPARSNDGRWSSYEMELDYTAHYDRAIA